ATAATLSFTSTLAQNGNQYRAVFTNPAGTATSNAATLTVQQAAITAVSVNWGTAGTAALQTAADGVRLLPAGRNTDLPWLGINKLNITLNQAETLTSADVSVHGLTVADYGPVTVSGSGTNYTLTLAQAINAADRVTVTIGNATIATFTRRLDVLPGDVNDDGVVNITDATIIRNEYTGFAPVTIPVIFLDVTGDGIVDVNDVNAARARIGTHLPALLA
ncbi:MAG TPA: dockerin type I repeat-containing protein, partial [Isosphaeraceae bacterium]|nr:dockerin type I repeat-containing protein [Isosphaeraceae bacterium]